MMSVFQIFKIIFGIIASVAILYFLVTYSGVYGKSQMDVQRSLIMKNFGQLVSNVYFSNNPMTFDFSRMNTDIFYDVSQDPVSIKFSKDQLQISTPLLFRPGSTVSITTKSSDYGWWKFVFVEAAPSMKVIFNPLETDPEIWGTMINITESLPDTLILDTKFKYAFCGYPGSNTISTPKEQFDFIYDLTLTYSDVTFSQCTAPITGDDILVTVSHYCSSSYSGSGLCVRPDGKFYIAGSDKEYYYMDGFDIAAAIIGGTKNDVHGLYGENMYMYKQRLFRNYMKLAADVMATRAQTLSSKIADLVSSGTIQSDSEPAACAVFYDQLSGNLSLASDSLSPQDYYENNAPLAGALNDANSVYNQLVDKGCEVFAQ